MCFSVATCCVAIRFFDCAMALVIYMVTTMIPDTWRAGPRRLATRTQATGHLDTASRPPGHRHQACRAQTAGHQATRTQPPGHQDPDTWRAGPRRLATRIKKPMKTLCFEHPPHFSFSFLIYWDLSDSSLLDPVSIGICQILHYYRIGGSSGRGQLAQAILVTVNV